MKTRLALALCVLLQTEKGDLRWPLGPGNEAYPLRATYGQLEGNDEGWLPHWGLDIVGNVPQQTVYAIEQGTVVRVRKYSNELSAVVVESAAVEGRAFLYLHLDKHSIDVSEDQEVNVGKRLGRIAKTNAGTGEPHLHLARLGGDYRNHAWTNLASLSEVNPLSLLKKVDKGDNQAPTLVPLPGPRNVALRDDDDGGAAGWKDVVVHAYDTDPLSTHRLAPRRLQLSITSEGQKTTTFRPLLFDGPLIKAQLRGFYDFSPEFPSVGDTTEGKYDYYFVLTNTGQEGTYDRAWMATRGKHVFHVEIEDAAGIKRTVEQVYDQP